MLSGVEHEESFISLFFFSSASMLDHSCEANAVITFHGNTLVVRSLQQITTSQPYKVIHFNSLSPSVVC